VRQAELVQRATADASCDGPGIVTREPDLTVAACKTGVSSRGELLAAVFRDHYQPPGPAEGAALIGLRLPGSLP